MRCVSTVPKLKIKAVKKRKNEKNERKPRHGSVGLGVIYFASHSGSLDQLTSSEAIPRGRRSERGVRDAPLDARFDAPLYQKWAFCAHLFSVSISPTTLSTHTLSFQPFFTVCLSLSSRFLAVSLIQCQSCESSNLFRLHSSFLPHLFSQLSLTEKLFAAIRKSS